MPATFKVSDEARAVLARSKVEGAGSSWTLALPNEQLDRKLYEDVNKALEAAGGKWNRSKRCHIFNRDPRADLGTTIEAGTADNRQQRLQAFYTPAKLANLMATLARVDSSSQVFEPSCGAGALMDACVCAGVPTTSIMGFDIDSDAIDKVRAKGYAASVEDFLTVTPKQIFTNVVMNPPFTKGQDIEHVLHAYKWLKPGGRLVSIMSPGWQTSEIKRAKQFREWLADRRAEECYVSVIAIEAGAFKESGTEIATVIVVVDAAAKE